MWPLLNAEEQKPFHLRELWQPGGGVVCLWAHCNKKYHLFNTEWIWFKLPSTITSPLKSFYLYWLMTRQACSCDQAKLRASHAEIPFLQSRRSFCHLNYSSRPLVAEMSQEGSATDNHHLSNIPTAIVHVQSRWRTSSSAWQFAVITVDIPRDDFRGYDGILHERPLLSPFIWIVNYSLWWYTVLNSNFTPFALFDLHN